MLQYITTMASSVDEVKNKLDIVEYIGQFVTLKKAGRNYKGLCPFHDEKSPSFVVSPDRQIWRCFGACQDGGDVISFLMKWENITFFEALQELAKTTGVKLKNVNFEDRKWKEKEVLLKINNYALKYFHYILMEHTSGEKARKYLKKRDIGKKLCKTFQLGYAPDSWDNLLKFLKVKGFSEKDIAASGLVIAKNNRMYDRFRGRIMFPIVDTRDSILGFSGRLMENKDKQAKYINTPETPLYKKRETLYGINIAKEAIRKEKKAIIVEGEFDMISSFKHGIKHTVAVKGSAVTKDQLMILKRLTDHLILALDADFSGAETAMRAIQDAEKYDFRIEVVRIDYAKDPDEALQEDPVKYKKLLDKAVPIYDFIIQLAIERHSDKSAYDKRDVVNEVMPFLHSISNPIVKNHYIKKLADMVDSDEKSIESVLHRFDMKQKSRKTYDKPIEEKKVDRFELMQQYVLSLIFQSDEPVEVYKKTKNVLQAEDFAIPAYKEIFENLKRYEEKMKENKGNDSRFTITAFAKNLSDPLQSVFDELILFDLSKVSYDLATVDLKKTLNQLKRTSLKTRLKEEVSKNSDEKLIKSLSKDLATVEKELGVM